MTYFSALLYQISIARVAKFSFYATNKPKRKDDKVKQNTGIYRGLSVFKQPNLELFKQISAFFAPDGFLYALDVAPAEGLDLTA